MWIGIRIRDKDPRIRIRNKTLRIRNIEKMKGLRSKSLDQLPYYFNVTSLDSASDPKCEEYTREKFSSLKFSFGNLAIVVKKLNFFSNFSVLDFC